MHQMEVNGFTLLEPAGRLDEGTSAQLRERLVRLLAEGPRDLVIDLSKVTSIDSFGLAVLLSGLTLSRRACSSFLLVMPTSYKAGETLRRAAFGEIFDLAPVQEVECWL